MSSKRRNASRNRTSFWKQRLTYLLSMAISSAGLGLGSYLFRDYPVIQKVLNIVTAGTLQGKPPEEALFAGLGELIQAKAAARSDREGGTFEVTVVRVEIDKSQFQDGQTIDLQMRVLTYDDEDRATVLWETRQFGNRLSVVGKDRIATAWPDRPFEITWRPGDRIVVEVWDRKAIWDKRTFRMAPPLDDAFPLRSGAYRLEPAKNRLRPGIPDTSRVVFESKRTAGLPEETTAAAGDDDTLRIR